MQLEAIIFDLDGTIADTIYLTIYSIKEYIRQKTSRILSDDEVLAEFGPTDTEIVKKYLSDIGNPRILEDYASFVAEIFDNFVKPIGGIEDLLANIKNKGIKTALFTGRSRLTTEIVLEKLGLKKYFDNICAGDDTSNFKPDPEGINKTLAKLGVRPESSAYVGDFDVDILAGRNAGTMSILALWSSSANKELKSLHPDAAFKTPYEFIEWLDHIK
jgi:phosphoglycolate phosphatase/pyrophosphatase PpaX